MRQLDENLLKLTRAELIKTCLAQFEEDSKTPDRAQATRDDPVDHGTLGVLEIESLVKPPGEGKRVQAERTPKTSAKKKKSSAPDAPGTEEEREIQTKELVASEERGKLSGITHLLRRSGRLENRKKAEVASQSTDTAPQPTPTPVSKEKFDERVAVVKKLVEER